MRRRLQAACAAGAVVLLGCEEKRFDPPDREARVIEAETIYSPTLFDTITWASAEDRLFTGNDVFGAHCRRCHGPLGEGGTPYALERDLDVPSLVEPDWEYTGDLDAVRRRTFAGHPEGMPVWGIGGITPREIDAVAYYILEQLRPDVLGSGTPASPR
jgi:mono/diheme cytochrome c family protein